MTRPKTTKPRGHPRGSVDKLDSYELLALAVWHAAGGTAPWQHASLPVFLNRIYAEAVAADDRFNNPKQWDCDVFERSGNPLMTLRRLSTRLFVAVNGRRHRLFGADGDDEKAYFAALPGASYQTDDALREKLRAAVHLDHMREMISFYNQQPVPDDCTENEIVELYRAAWRKA